MEKIILCHKCSGVLAGNDEAQRGLYGCGCISGYVRGFEPLLSREEAIEKQIQAQLGWIELFKSQKREPVWIYRCQATIDKLRSMLPELAHA